MNASSLPDEQTLMRLAVRECAKLGSPGGMMRPNGPLIGKIGIYIQDFFVERLTQEFWSHPPEAHEYPRWHQNLSQDLADSLARGKRVRAERSAFALAAKFVDTFMPHLAKFPEFRALYPALYLPLDRTVTPHLRRELRCAAILAKGGKLYDLLRAELIYKLSQDDYYVIQGGLGSLAEHIGKRIGRPAMARIELNLLWALG